MAIQLIDSYLLTLTGKYTDDYPQAMLDIIQAKVEGEEISIPLPRRKGS